MSQPRPATTGESTASPALALGRRFWPIVIVGGLATIALLVALLEWQGRRLIVTDQERTNEHVVRMVGNVVWPAFGEFIKTADRLTIDELRAHPALTDLGDTVRAMVAESNVVKVKIFSPRDGRTLFSTDPKQIGSQHPGEAFDRALRGELSGAISHRDDYVGLAGKLQDVDLYATYLPFRHRQGGEIDAVLEVYSNVTERMAAHRESRALLAIGVLASLSLTYAVIFTLARRASKVLVQAEFDKIEHDRKLRHQAYHDALTGLPNRTRFNELCVRTAADKRKRQYGVLSIDLDRFKMVNDSMGQRVGDAVLRQVAQRIAKALRESDKVFRLGGDEFVALIASDDQALLDVAAQRVITAMGKRIVVDEVDVVVSVSVGIARWPDDAATLEEAVACADLAMAAAKRAGTNQHARYRAEMKRALDDEVTMLSGLRQGLSNKEFLLHFQPRLNSRSGAIESVEALLRWNHPSLGMLPPGKFIAILENSPLIVDVGAWVMEAACAQVAQWRREGFRTLNVSVNVSARQFRHKGLIHTVQHVLQATGLPPQALELEITEGQMIHDVEEGATTIERLKSLGVQLSIDDFGTGYSSLAYLQRLPIDCIKIDRAFVKDLGVGKKSGNIARAIASMAHSLDLKVVAEGVETDAQANILRGMGCEQLQGFLFSKPVAPADLHVLLKQHAKRAALTEEASTRPMPLGASSLVLA
jgi:diguanylate cyclase (GGDEF)-like protein